MILHGSYFRSMYVFIRNAMCWESFRSPLGNIVMILHESYFLSMVCVGQFKQLIISGTNVTLGRLGVYCH